MTSRLAPTLLARTVASALLAALVGLAYAKTLDAPFVFDDRVQIVDNPLVRHPEAWFDRDAEAQLDVSPPQSRAIRSRFLVSASFALDAGGETPEARRFHVTNGLIHLASTLALFALALAIAGIPDLARSALRPRALPFAFLAAALFGLHPLQTQAVTYVVQRATSFAGLLGLLAVLSHLASRRAASLGSRFLFGAGTLLALGGAMATKESAVAYPLLVVLADLALVRGETWRRRLVALAPALAALALVPLRIALLLPAGPGLLEGLGLATRTGDAADRWTYFLTQLDVHRRYLRLVVWPAGQSVDHVVAWATGPLQARVVAGAVAVALVVGASFVALRVGSARDPGWHVVGLGGLWFFLAQAVESSVVPIADPMVEHRLYLPIAGAALAAASTGTLLSRGAPSRRAMALVGAAAVLALTVATRARNELWRDELSLWESAAAAGPESARARYNVGSLRAARGELDLAESSLRRALEIDPELAPAELNLGTIAAFRGDLAEAERRFARALELDPTNWIAAVNLGDLRRRQGSLAEARRLYERAAESAPHETAPRARLASLPPPETRDTLRAALPDAWTAPEDDDAADD